MKKTLFLVIISTASLMFSCEKSPIFIPVKGSISGSVVDNNGAPLNGVKIQANFTPPENISGSSPASSATASTQTDGTYELNELWDQVALSIEQEGFQPVYDNVKLTRSSSNLQLDFTLIGSPTVQSITLSKGLLAESETDSILISIAAQDLYNSNTESYQGKLLIQDDSGQTKIILTAEEQAQSNTVHLFTSTLSAGRLSAGLYQVVAEITDPDGNTHTLTAPEQIQVQ